MLTFFLREICTFSVGHDGPNEERLMMLLLQKYRQSREYGHRIMRQPETCDPRKPLALRSEKAKVGNNVAEAQWEAELGRRPPWEL